MRLLIVSYYFPPAGGGGVQRVLAWCRNLSELGIDVTVLAPENPQWVDVDTTLVVPPNTRVVRSFDPSPPPIIPRAEMAKASGPWQKLVTRIRLQPRRFALPDIHKGWRAHALRALEEHLAEQDDHAPWDIVVSTSPPETTHLIAREIAERFGIPWVADFRDSWLDLPHLRLDKMSVRYKHRRNVKIAAKTLERASAITTVSTPLADDLCKRYPSTRVEVLENGIDLDKVKRALPRVRGFYERDAFTVTYTGNFFGQQSPRWFLDAIEIAVEREPELKDSLLVKFAGGLKATDTSRIDNDPLLSEVVEQLSFVRHDDILSMQAAASLLLLHVAPGRGSQGVFTGKVFEYVAARRPVLAMVPHDNVTVELLDSAGSTEAPRGMRVEPDRPEEIASAIMSAWRAWREDREAFEQPIMVPETVMRRIDRYTSSKKLADLLFELTSQK